MTLVTRDLVPSRVDLARFKVGAVVSGADWALLARQRNHLVGQGRTLVPAFTPPHPMLPSRQLMADAGATFATAGLVYAFRLLPSYPAIERRWLVTLQSYLHNESDADVDSIRQDNELAIAAPDGTEADLGVTPSAYDPFVAPDGTFEASTPRTVTETVASQTETATDVDLTIRPSGHWNLRVLSIACVEVPRTLLEVDAATDDGVGLSRLAAGQPGIASEMQRVVAAPSAGRQGRRVLAQVAVPYASTDGTLLDTETWLGNITVKAPVVEAGWTLAPADTSYKTLVTLPVLGRALEVGASSTQVRVDIHCWAVGAVTSFSVSAEAGSGDSDTWSQAGPASPTWVSQLTLDINAEDVATAGGGAEDTITVSVRHNSGAGTVYISSVAVYEDV